MFMHVPEAEPRVPPDPTRYPDHAWGDAYPCLTVQRMGESKSFQCGGKMIPGKRCARHDDILWRRFTCNRCGRVAHDTKVPPPDWRQSSS